MSDETVEVPFGDNPSDEATLLLAAAEELGLPEQCVTIKDGSTWVVPPEVRDLAFSETEPEQAEE